MGTEILYVRSEAGEFVPTDRDVIVDAAKARGEANAFGAQTTSKSPSAIPVP